MYYIYTIIKDKAMKIVKISTSEIDNHMTGMAAAQTKAIMKYQDKYSLIIESRNTKYIITK